VPLSGTVCNAGSIRKQRHWLYGRHEGPSVPPSLLVLVAVDQQGLTLPIVQGAPGEVKLPAEFGIHNGAAGCCARSSWHYKSAQPVAGPW
jgi:hypothetical protein